MTFSHREPTTVQTVLIPGGLRPLLVAWRKPHWVVLSADMSMLVVSHDLRSFRQGRLLSGPDMCLLDACFVGDRVLMLLKKPCGALVYVMQQDPSMDPSFLAAHPPQAFQQPIN